MMIGAMKWRLPLTLLAMTFGIVLALGVAASAQGPSITITNPAAGAVFKSGDTFTLSADVSDGDGIQTGSIEADISQVTGSSGDTAVAPDSVTGSSTDKTATWSVTVGSVSSGNKTMTVSATDTLSNSNSATRTVEVDNTPPTVSSITRVNATPTNASSVDFAVNFSESVSGVDTSDVVVTTTNTANGSVSSVSGSGSSYTVTVGSITGDGDLQLDVSDDDSITDDAGNPLGGSGTGNGDFTSGESYTIDNTAPSVSFTRNSPTSPTNDSSVIFDLTFSESVSNIDTGDFTLNTTNTAGGTIASVSASSGTAVTLTVNSITGDGDLGLDISGSTDIQDDAGNVLNTTPTTDQVFVIDNTAPTVSFSSPDPTGDDFVNASEETSVGLGGSSSDTNGVNDVTLEITDTGAGSVSPSVSGTTSWSATADVSTLSEGTITYTATATDDAGNANAASITDTHDSIAPSAPTNLDMTAASDSGSSASDDITNDQTPEITGDAEAGSTVDLSSSVDGAVGSATASGGTWSITTSTLTGNFSGTDHTLTATATDEAGNTSPSSSGLTVTIDTGVNAPATPDLAAGSDSGASSTDDITNDQTPQFTGSSCDNDSDITLNSSVNGDLSPQDVSCSGGTYDVSVTTTLDGSTSGTAHDIRTDAEDTAGNTASSGTLSMTVDTGTPTPTIDLDGGSDSGRSNTDDITNVTTPTFTGNAEAGADIRIDSSVDGSGVGTGTASGGTYSITTGTLSGTASGTDHGMNATATDTAGNSATSSTLTVTIDTGVNAPSMPDLHPTTDSGTSNSDDLTNDQTPRFTGTAEADAEVELSSDVDGTLSPTGLASGGSYDITLTTTLTGGSPTGQDHSITAVATDVAGNVSSASSGLALTVDTGTSTPTIDLDAASDNGPSASDDITNDTTPTLSGSAEADASVALSSSVDGGSGSATATGGSWSITSSSLTGGDQTTHDMTAEATDLAGNSATSAALSVTIDTVAPAGFSETIGSPKFNDGSTVFVTSSTNLSVDADDSSGAGTGINGCERQVDGGGFSTYGTVSGGALNGDAFTLPTPDGPRTYDVRCTDVAGNTSSTFSRTRTVDDTAPGNYSETIASPSFDDGSTIFVKSTTSIRVDGDDDTGADNNGSGIASCQLQIAGNGFNAYGTVSGGALTGNNFTLPTPDGAKSYDLNCTDQLGNTSTNFSRTRTVDDSAPGNYALAIGTPSFAGGGTTFVASADNTQVGPTGLNVDGNDNTGMDSNGAGINNCQVDIDDGTGFSAYGTVSGGALTGNTFNLRSPDGPKGWQVSCEDQLGNQSTFTQSLTVDDTPPGNYILNIGSPSFAANGTTYVASPSNPDLSATGLSVDGDDNTGADGNGAGVTGCELDIDDGGGFSTYGTVAGGTLSGDTFNLKSPDGPKNWNLRCTDRLGNQSSNFTQSLTVDDTPPDIDAPRHQNTTCHPASNCASGSEALVANTFVKAQDEASVVSNYPSVSASLFDYPGFRDPDAGANPGSGVESCALSGTQSNTPNYTADTDFRIASGDGSKTFELSCDDNLGNNFVETSPSLNVDDTAPDIPNNLSHDNTTCWPAGNCSGAAEIVQANVFVKAQDKQPFDPGSLGLPLQNPLLPAYPTLVPKSTFQWEQADANGTIQDPVTGGVNSGLRDCVLTGGTTIDNTIRQPAFSEVFNVVTGDGTRTFQDNCRDNLGNQAETNANPIRVDDTPPSADFTTAGPRYNAPDGVIFIKSTTQITPILSDGGVGVDLSGEGPPDPLGNHPTCQQNLDQNAGLVQPCLTTFTFPPPDQDHGFWIMRPDKLGNVDISFFPFVVDDTAPEITVDQPTEQAEYVLNEEVLAQWEVSDDISFFEDGQESPFNPGLDPRGSGIRDLTATAADGQPIDTDNVGAQAFNILAIDNLDHQDSVTITYRVVYAFERTEAFAERLEDGPFAPGETIEIGFRLEDADGVFQSGAQPQVQLLRTPADGETEEVALGDDPAIAQLNDEGDRYVYELATDGLEPGSYAIQIQPGDGTTHRVEITLGE